MDLQRDAQRLIENIRSELSPKSHPKLALLVNNSLEMFVSVIQPHYTRQPC